MTDIEFAEYRGLAIKAALSFRSKYPHLEYHDLFQTASAGLVTGHQTFDSSKGCSLSTWLYRNCFFSLQNEYSHSRQCVRTHMVVSELGDYMTFDQSFEDRLLTRMQYECIMKILTEKERVIVKDLISGKSLAQIGKDHGYGNRQYMSTLRKNIQKKVLEYV